MFISENLMIVIFMLFGMLAGAIIVLIVKRKIEDIEVGTLIIDTRGETRDICRFVLDADLATIAECEKVTVKVKVLAGEDKRLVSFNDYD